MKNNQVSYFKRVKFVLPSENITLDNVVEIIKSNKYKLLVNRLRQIEDKEIRKKIKARNLGSVTFTGIFIKRNIKGFLNSSNVTVFDYDNYSDNKELFNKLIKDKYVMMVFKSPSGGLKIVVKIGNFKLIDYVNIYKNIIRYFKKEYKIKLDDKTIDISRLCYLSYDPDIFVNWESQIYDIPLINTYKEEKKELLDKKQDKKIRGVKPCEDRSAKDFAFVCDLLEQGKKVQDIQNIMNVYGSDRWKENKSTYQENLIRNAKKRTRS